MGDVVVVVAGTGHRPDKLGGYHDATTARLQLFATRCLERLQPSLVISGMALGWDRALADAAVSLRIPFDAYIPFTGQERRWPQTAQGAYRRLLKEARTVVVCSPGGYAPWKMQIRNQRMVDAADVLLALWNGSAGGTANCWAYATQRFETTGRPTLYNVWRPWQRCA